MRLLITGICGFVGSTLAAIFARDGDAHEIIGIDNFSRAGSELNRRPLLDLGVQIIGGDIRSSSDVDNLPAVDWVIDAAANPSVLAGVDGKTSSRQLIEHNLNGTINLLEFCKSNQAGFILLSTSRVYSIPPLAGLEMIVMDHAFSPACDQMLPVGISANGISESYATSSPVSLYGSTKVCSENLALEYGFTFDFPVWINRCGVMAGAGQFGRPDQGIVAYWIHSFREGKPLKYIGFGGDGHQVRDCLHPRDLIPIIRKQFAVGHNAIGWSNPEKISSESHEASNRILNFGGGISSAFSLAQLTAWCSKRFPHSATIESLKPVGGSRQKSGETRKYDLPWVVLDHCAATQVWEWSPRVSKHEIFDEVATFSENHPDWLKQSR